MGPGRWLSSSLAVVCAVAAVQAEERPVIETVEVVGCQRIDVERVRYVLGTRVGKPLDFLVLADDVRAIERLGPFTGTRVEQVLDRTTNRVGITFHVSELPIIGSVTFAGVNFFQRSGLDKKIQTRAGAYLNPVFLEDDRKGLELHFQEKGQAFARATTAAPVEDGVARVVFTIDLGHDVAVGSTLYDGLPAEVYSRTIDAALVNQPGAPYIPEMLDLDRDAVARTLQDLGYLDAVCAPAELHYFDLVRPDEDRRRHGPRFVPDAKYEDRVMARWKITPGRLWHLGTVAAVGNTVVSEADLLRAFAMAAGEPYRRSTLDASLSRAQHLVRNLGYARCSIRIDSRPDPETGLVHVVLHVFEGDLYTLDRVDVYGNNRTRDAVVRRALRLHPGDLWNEDAYDRSKGNVNRTGLFKGPPNAVRLERQFDDDRPGRVDLVVNVDEDSTGQFRVQIGYSTSSGFFGELGYQEHNFDIMKAMTFSGWRGGGQSLDFSGSIGTNTRSISTSWTNPSLWDGPYSLTLSMARTQSSRLDWDELRLTPSIGIGRNFLDNDLRIGLSYQYTDLAIDGIDADASNEALDGAGDYYLNSLTFRATYDRLDHPRLPTRGYRLGGTYGVTGGPLVATDEYSEWTARGDLFVPLHTFALGGTLFFHVSERWQQSNPLGNSDTVPFYDRYYGGGPAPRHRGFESGDLTPSSINRNGFEARDGGTIDSLATAEVVVQVQGENDKIRLVLFSDWGNVIASGDQLNIGDFRTALGFGVRFPVQLPVALDFAWLLNADSGERENQIHFSLGFQSF